MFKFFSVDDHVVEPANVWVDRVPEKYRELAPHVVYQDGRQWWEFEDQRVYTMGLNAVAGKPPEQWRHEPTSYADMIPGCYDPIARAQDMLLDGITASVCFPTLPRFGGVLFTTFKDKDLASACVRAWNDWMIDEWCAAVPDMFVPMPIVQIWDPVAAAAELQRCLDKGARAMCFPEETSLLGLPSFYTDFYDPLWAVVEEAGIPVCMHIGSAGMIAYQPEGATHALPVAAAHSVTIMHAVGMMMSPIPRKFPNIKIVYSEGGIGWVPSTLERADRQYLRHRHWSKFDDVLPSEICKRNMWFCMIEEPYGLSQRYEIGVDRIVWECDYPHADTPWPHSQRNAHEVFAGVPQEEIDLITHGTAEKLFRFPCRDVAHFESLGLHPAQPPALV